MKGTTTTDGIGHGVFLSLGRSNSRWTTGLEVRRDLRLPVIVAQPDIARLDSLRCSNYFSACVRHLILWSRHEIGGSHEAA